MAQSDWTCLVCEAPNLAKTEVCRLCAAPAKLSDAEIELRRSYWESSEDVHRSKHYKPGLASKLALFLVADIVFSLVFMSFTTLSGGNAVGAGLLGVFLLVPAPFLSVAWIAVVTQSLWKR